ncbi:RING-H2 finger protein ATL52-like [Senna tora]|uniref:RING-H2 finger protein ATL52-like n=1 Tax=Senna tora TaxID=362788 RepID=A0A834T4D0_9FABA|nr:RING-H2 finger protein ATL52-like [Senna tora]
MFGEFLLKLPFWVFSSVKFASFVVGYGGSTNLDFGLENSDLRTDDRRLFNGGSLDSGDSVDFGTLESLISLFEDEEASSSSLSISCRTTSFLNPFVSLPSSSSMTRTQLGKCLTSSSPLSNSDQKSNMPMLYYGLVVVATAAIVLAVYNLIVIKRCGRRHMPPPSQPTNIGVVEERRSLSRNLLSSFKYKKEAEEEEEEGEGGLGISRRSGRDCEEDSCAVCLSGFEEGEEVRKLPRCNHCFHVMCIDMWLYSHFDCPICRTPVVAAFSRSSGDENAVAVAVSV